MSLPSCFGILNAQFFANITLQIQACETAEELQALIDQVYADISMLESNITSQLAFLGELEVLLISPADLGAIVTWLQNFITSFLTPYLKPLITMAAQMAQLASDVAQIEAVINEVKDLKFPGIDIPIPTIAIGCSL